MIFGPKKAHSGAKRGNNKIVVKNMGQGRIIKAGELLSGFLNAWWEGSALRKDLEENNETVL